MISLNNEFSSFVDNWPLSPEVKNALNKVPAKRNTQARISDNGLIQELGESTLSMVDTAGRNVKELFAKIGDPLGYPRKKKIQELAKGILENQKIDKEEGVVFVGCEEDHNGGISLHYQDLDNIHYLSRNFNITVLKTSDIRDIDEAVRLISKLGNKKISALVLAGHGSNRRLIFNRNKEHGILWKDFDPKIFKSLDTTNSPAIILNSCRTGQGDDSLASHVAAKVKGARVFAPNDTTFSSGFVIYGSKKTPVRAEYKEYVDRETNSGLRDVTTVHYHPVDAPAS